MAAKMRTIDWRERRCRRRHLVLPCRSRSQHGRRRQVRRREGEHDPSDAEPYQ